MDFLCISTTDWDEIWGSRQQIMSRLAQKGNRVVFVERQVGPEHLLKDPYLRKQKISSWKRPALREIEPNIWLLNPPISLPGRYYTNRINHFNQSRLADWITDQLQSTGIRQPVLWIYPPHSAPLVGKFNEILSVYHCIDRFSAGTTGRKKRTIERQESELLEKVDIVFTHSLGLKSLFEKKVNQPIFMLPSAADVAFFQSIEAIHPDLSEIPHPRLGIFGTLDERIDSTNLLKIGASHPEWQFLLVGRIRPGFVHLPQLKMLNNFHFLGNRLNSELPSLMNGCDVLLAPYTSGEKTEFINPLKIYEYLSIGKPVVSTPLPEIRDLSHYLIFAVDAKEFVHGISEALVDETSEKTTERRQVARAFNWNHRVDFIIETIQKASVKA
jgi:glycosyltransferase involved in cell wall biosynthesis